MAVTISAIIPTHDRPASLRRCLDSVLTQSRLPNQLIIVNDGADLCVALLESLDDAPLPVEIIHRHPPSSTASRNAGLDAATGDVVLLLEDDIALPADFIEQLVAIYSADADGVIGGIGPRIREPDTESPTGRAWLAACRILGRGRWGPRHVASRYATLPPALAGQLQPVRKLSAGGLSLRADVARSFRFDEMLSGYAWGEDRELTFRIAPLRALYRARRLQILHHRVAGGRGDWRSRGRAYVTNTLHIARSAGGGAGTAMLITWDLAGTILQYAAWVPLSPTRRDKLQFLRGLTDGLLRRACQAAGRCLCE